MEPQEGQQPVYLKPPQPPQHSQKTPDPAMIGHVNTLNTKLRLLEERFTNVRRKSQLTEHNMLANQKKRSLEFKSLQSEIKELKNQLRELNEKTIKIMDELGRFAKREELKTLTTYITLWDMSRFMTREEAYRLVKKSGPAPKTKL